ncbi:MAG: MerR family transcriptional regulator [Acidimicrobiia bacterium]|nr:MerR family transcriptional regulator [Acidimicrobiia bacterium]
MLPIDEDQVARYSVGQVAEMLGVQPAFVRRLDMEAVVRPSRSGGGQRRYTRSEIDQVQHVSEMAGEGLTLAGIRRILMLEAEVASLQRQLQQQRSARQPPHTPTAPEGPG